MNSVVRITDRPDMTSAVYRRRILAINQNKRNLVDIVIGELCRELESRCYFQILVNSYSFGQFVLMSWSIRTHVVVNSYSF